jgi:Mannosyltransferase (PIG-V)
MLGNGKEPVQNWHLVNESDSEIEQRRTLIRSDVAWVLQLFASSRLLLVALIFFSRQTIARGPHVVVSTQNEHGGTLLDILTQWDGNWYRLIAERGYAPPMPDVAAAFFPVYPMLVRAVAFIVRDLQVACVLVSNGCLIASALLLLRLLRLDYDALVSRRTLIFLMFNPVSFFLSAAYTESTFLLLSVGALLAVRQSKWGVAGLCGGLLSATRAPGLLIGLPLLTEHILQWRARGQNWREFFRPHLLWLAVIPAGLAAWMFVCYLQRGDFLMPMHALDAGWKKNLTLPWNTFLWPRNFAPSHIALYQAIIGSSAILIAAGFFLRLRATYLVYAGVSLIFYLSWGSLDGLPRYLSILFPIQIILALLSCRWKSIYEPLLAFSIGLLALCTILFANAYQMT